MNESNENAQIASELQLRISRLTDFNGDDLKLEMASLKKAILENPAACSLLLPEDIGMAVAALRRMVGVAVAKAAASKAKPKSDKPKKLSAAELAKAMSEVSDDDF
ncbi:MAG: hypothetical protein ACD_86C00003G0009 [uncultured bacterium]|nr:MAG: hypothetical protein ACD_86C00003G0009 [uncultured bacterium]